MKLNGHTLEVVRELHRFREILMEGFRTLFAFYFCIALYLVLYFLLLCQSVIFFLSPSYFHNNICKIIYFDHKPIHSAISFTLKKGFSVIFLY